MRGRWAAGIVPRNFAWIVKDRLAVSERPGGQAPYHRRVRRQEEILWLRAQQFTRVVSLLGSTHNLHAYDELGMTHSHFPIPAHADLEAVLGELYPALHGWLRAGERVLLHQEELGDRLAGVVAGFLCWSRLLPEPPRAIAWAEQLMRRQLGANGRAIVAVAVSLPPPDVPASPTPFGPTASSVGLPATDAYPSARTGEDPLAGPGGPAVSIGTVGIRPAGSDGTPGPELLGPGAAPGRAARSRAAAARPRRTGSVPEAHVRVTGSLPELPPTGEPPEGEIDSAPGPVPAPAEASRRRRRPGR